MDSPSRPSLGLLFAAVGAVAVVHAIGVVLIAPLGIVALFRPLPGILAPLLGLAVLGAVTAGVLRLTTRRWRVATAVVATVATSAAYVVLLLKSGEYPISWFPPLGIDVGGVLAGLAGAATTALALPRWPLRLLGAAGVIAILVVATGPGILERQAAQQEQEALDQASSEAEAERRLREFTRPVTVDLPGVRVAQTAPAEYISWLRIVSADGGVMDVDTVPDDVNTPEPAFPCWLMVRDLGSFDDSVTLEDYAGSCGPAGEGRWETTDGRAIGVRFEDRLVIVRSPRAEFPLPDGDVRPASPAELREAVENLRLLTLAELRDLIAAIDYGDAG